MTDNSIPADSQYPITSPTIIYWRGLDHLTLNWERTRSFGADPIDIGALHEYVFWRTNLIIWACCAIEAFVNEEGVAWLNESFYRANLERLGICQKIDVLYALKYRKTLVASNDVILEVKRLFDFRNGLVHPKTRSVTKNCDSKDEIRAKLDLVSPDQLRNIFCKVTDLFKSQGVGDEPS